MAVLVEPRVVKAMFTALDNPPPLICSTVLAQFTPPLLPVTAPVTVCVGATPVEVSPFRLPRNALDMASPASTWKAELAEVKARDCVPSVLVLTEATMPALAKALTFELVPVPAL